ncbi:MAG: YitT family protein [Tissierellaceae bacterium]|jgi:uncharacterized membrane-anchored protein YitT (DUF2179 family)|nr:YitT family protein [Tissierellaceae bacterium]
MKKKANEYIKITVGMLLVAIGLYFFLMPKNLSVGGANGLAIVINHFIPNLSIGLLMIIINIFLFAIGFIFIGTNFGFKTIYASFGVSVLVLLFEKIFPMKKPLANDILIQLILGVIISAIGIGIVFNQNASTGGTDIIAKILNRFWGIDLGRGVLISDLSITLAAGFAYGLQIGLYSLLGVLLNGLVIDAAIESMNIRKQVVIVSNYSEVINDYIIKSLGKGATLYEAKGGFTGSDKEVLVTILSRKDFVLLKNLINSIDKNAFIIVHNVHEVIGEGFKDIENF